MNWKAPFFKKANPLLPPTPNQSNVCSFFWESDRINLFSPSAYVWQDIMLWLIVTLTLTHTVYSAVYELM